MGKPAAGEQPQPQRLRALGLVAGAGADDGQLGVGRVLAAAQAGQDGAGRAFVMLVDREPARA
ncbi:hypothetical protein [Amycolatopsis sp. NPDC050768]|uniref:hypothetical protein n=1 Tax=Amycolatopsis sp. NPDC050768 TaxID=3154839 RepID=UPI0033D5C26A